MKNARLAFSLLASLAVALTPFCGCQSEATGENAKLEKLAADVNSVAKRSGGDWEKLSKEEKKMMTDLQHGNEQSAKNLLHALSGQTYQGKWGKPGDGKTVKPGWADAGGPPPGPGGRPVPK
ncbi:MAG: hypothetical protein H7145_19045 [Akkermansiaceae bacterium]|nr:hypothetical protein [Armatimonadota bacterium]